MSNSRVDNKNCLTRRYIIRLTRRYIIKGSNISSTYNIYRASAAGSNVFNNLFTIESLTLFQTSLFVNWAHLFKPLAPVVHHNLRHIISFCTMQARTCDVFRSSCHTNIFRCRKLGLKLSSKTCQKLTSYYIY